MTDVRWRWQQPVFAKATTGFNVLPGEAFGVDGRLKSKWKEYMKPQHPKARIENDLYEAILLLKSKEEAKKFFEDLCTPNERQAMADRWRVIVPIKEGVPYRTIYEETGVSVTTIGRVARCLSHGSGGYELIFERWQKKKST